MNKIKVFVDRIGERKNNSVAVNLTLVWESGAISKKVQIDEELLTEITSQKSSNAVRQTFDKLITQVSI